MKQYRDSERGCFAAVCVIWTFLSRNSSYLCRAPYNCSCSVIFRRTQLFPNCNFEKKYDEISHATLCQKIFFKSGHMMLLQVISTNQCKIIFLPLWYIRIFPCLLTLYARIFMQRNIHLNFSKVNTSCQLSRKKRGRSFSCPPTCAQDGYCQCVLQYE